MRPFVPSATVRRLTPVAFMLLVVASSAPAISAEPQRALTFEADAPTESVDSNEPLALLASCDKKLESCTTDAVGMPYLIAAYLVLWAILVIYFTLARRGQRRLREELDELRALVREYEDTFLKGSEGDTTA